MKKHYRKENDCLNCGAELQGRFCHVCGQENLQIKENFGHMMNHAISDYFHFDHHFFNTLKPLVLNPGKLTNEYMAGKRVRYLHPVKMYIFISLVYFLLLFQSGFEPVKINTTNDKAVTKKSIEATNKSLDSVAKNPYIPALAKAAILKAKKNNAIALKKADTAADDVFLDKKTKKHHYSFFGDADNKDTTYQQYLASQQKLADNKKDGFFMRRIRKREFDLNASDKDVKSGITEGIKHNTPKMMFLLLPIFALILKIVFWKNKKYYVEHLIYSFHLHCFLFLFLAIIILLKMPIPATGWETVRGCVDLFAFLVIVWYIYTSLRVVYHRTPGRTITKMIGITFSYLTVFGIAMMLLVILVALFD